MLRAWKVLLTAGATLAATSLAAAPAPLRVNGSTTINPVVVEASEILRRERGLVIQVDTQGGSSGGMAALGEGRAEAAMVSRPLIDEDRAHYPKAHFEGTRIGLDGVALVVSRDVWQGGIHTLTRAQLRGLYEGKVKNWKEIGGPDRRVVFFNKEAGRGTWGDTLLTGGLLLAVMILPTVMTLADDALSGVAATQRLAARALGLTRAETALRVSLRQAFPGLVSALLLGLGRALGETIAVFLVIGRQDNQWPERLLSLLPLTGAGQTLTTKLGGSETFIAYGDPLHWGAIMGLGLVLFVVVGAVSVAGARLATWGSGRA